MMRGGADVAELERRIAALSGKEAAVTEERRRLRVRRARSLHNELYPPCCGDSATPSRAASRAAAAATATATPARRRRRRRRRPRRGRVLPRLPHVECGLPADALERHADRRRARLVRAGEAGAALQVHAKRGADGGGARHEHEGEALLPGATPTSSRRRRTLGGTVRLRTQLKQLPIAVYLNAAALEVKKVRVGEARDLQRRQGDRRAAAARSTDLDVGTMETPLPCRQPSASAPASRSTAASAASTATCRRAAALARRLERRAAVAVRVGRRAAVVSVSIVCAVPCRGHGAGMSCDK